MFVSVSCIALVCNGVVPSVLLYCGLLSFYDSLKYLVILLVASTNSAIMVQFTGTGGNGQLYIWGIVTIKLISNAVIIIIVISRVWLLLSVKGSFPRVFRWCMSI